jgi:hypothetical protein
MLTNESFFAAVVLAQNGAVYRQVSSMYRTATMCWWKPGNLGYEV